jgi:hypothetical protein
MPAEAAYIARLRVIPQAPPLSPVRPARPSGQDMRVDVHRERRARVPSASETTLRSRQRRAVSSRTRAAGRSRTRRGRRCPRSRERVGERVGFTGPPSPRSQTMSSSCHAGPQSSRREACSLGEPAKRRRSRPADGSSGATCRSCHAGPTPCRRQVDVGPAELEGARRVACHWWRRAAPGARTASAPQRQEYPHLAAVGIWSSARSTRGGDTPEAGRR